MTGGTLEGINEACRKKRLRSAMGTVVKGPITAIWLRSDGAVFYVERHKIPILLHSESIVVQDIADRELRTALLVNGV